MSNLDERIGDAVEWFQRSQLPDGRGGAGWGWVSDVPPNPQNTAEVVCALARAGRAIPRVDEVSALVRQPVIQRDERGEWAFRTPIDLSWRLRALHCLGAPETDADVVAGRDALIAEADAGTGGWRLSDRVGPVSITSTANAIQALAPLAASDENVARTVLRGTGFLVESMLDQDPRVQPLYASAHVATALARPEIAAVGGRRVERARDLAVQRLLAGLGNGDPQIEEEPFRRGDFADTWRHLALHLTVGALLTAEPKTIFDPVVRNALTQLLDLQETGPLRTHRGGFRTSPEGFVTSFATTQALEAMLGARQVVNENVNPARIFDMICQEQGRHHADAQRVVSLRGRAVVMNSLAGAASFGLGGAAGLTIAMLAVGFGDELGKIGSRALVVWGMLFLALGTLAAVTTRFPAASKRGIAAAVFAGYTALALPIVSFLLA
ncbi:hypothetical protein LTV02_21055 [Nocardia yamanashiensis]|uniref:hypothetical protein n=1 Tax=Nocardia yamanashiensis TaxID=209247 RepID=UPI001E584867|nr:hypothetical protein [Nocardia yamanashiensis]UGT38626.1 hypothetical protein LTV02_21055 [Nocardia yamanashiensis]